MDWDHLRFFAALVQAGSLAGAARLLQVEHTTVARRLRALEKVMGQALFVRHAGAFKLTQAGQQLLPAVQTMEKAVPEGVDDDHPAGLVRVGATEGLGTVLLANQLARLTLRYPQLSVDLLALPRLLHLSRREADIVISLERPKRGSVIVTKLADYHLYLYGERQYLARLPLVRSSEDLRHHGFVHYVDDLLFSKELQLLDQVFKPERFVFRSTSIVAQYEAVRCGVGLAVLPAFMADRDPTLQRVLPEQARFTRTFWMSMPQEAKAVPRIQAVWRFLKDVVREQQGRLMP